jgi:hypothetical protein
MGSFLAVIKASTLGSVLHFGGIALFNEWNAREGVAVEYSRSSRATMEVDGDGPLSARLMLTRVAQV